MEPRQWSLVRLRSTSGEFRFKGDLVDALLPSFLVFSLTLLLSSFALDMSTSPRRTTFAPHLSTDIFAPTSLVKSIRNTTSEATWSFLRNHSGRLIRSHIEKGYFHVDSMDIVDQSVSLQLLLVSPLVRIPTKFPADRRVVLFFPGTSSIGFGSPSFNRLWMSSDSTGTCTRFDLRRSSR